MHIFLNPTKAWVVLNGYGTEAPGGDFPLAGFYPRQWLQKNRRDSADVSCIQGPTKAKVARDKAATLLVATGFTCVLVQVRSGDFRWSLIMGDPREKRENKILW
ncbi:hypothetical protein NDU88_006417 [Pleurodeles waltl]|uniref:Uncharacterized protein n=1 Tax=Pleurodeles waltl TaxID=8319 RepID=A0AAV7MDU9_PLEWA|nr:hypothetical protein NDU88_006417 [Pleurodeles waltl]